MPLQLALTKPKLHLRIGRDMSVFSSVCFHSSTLSQESHVHLHSSSGVMHGASSSHAYLVKSLGIAGCCSRLLGPVRCYLYQQYQLGVQRCV